MTAAQITEEAPDLAVAWRLINWQLAGPRPATEEEMRLAVWLMLDLERSRKDIMECTGLTRFELANLAALRTMAGPAEDGDTEDITRQREAARMLAPTADQRSWLCVCRGITRPVVAPRRRRLRAVQ